MTGIKKISFFFILLIVSANYAQQARQPKLVVGIVIDQMRFDYLQRYEQYYSEGGFKRLIKEGSSFTYAHYNYIPTSTGPGHASIYTGTIPFYNGIISNDWYDRKTKSFVNCVGDNEVRTIGETTTEGQSSPRKLMTTTISDQIKIATNGKSRVFSISIKDRAAILPGGHSPDEVYWYSPESGKFVTSTYYTKSLPPWVIEFNKKDVAGSLFRGGWDLLLPAADYALSYPDEAPWEEDVFEEGKTSFPHSFSNVQNKKYDLIRSTPFGNDLLLKFAEALIEHERPGSGNYTDFLAISFSSTDFIGHAYGPNSVEIEDAFIRMDRELAELLNNLDRNVGKGNYILFLTADHAVSEVPGFLRNMHIPSGSFSWKNCRDSLQAFSERKYGTDKVIENFSNDQVYLNKKILKEKDLNVSEVEDAFGEYLQDESNEIEKVFLRHNLRDISPSRIPNNYILNGFYPERSGNIAFELKPNFISGHKHYGTTHGSAFPYDTHVALIFYGWNVPAEQINSPVYVVDIAATVCNMLGITEPTGCIGIPIIKK